MKRTFLDSVVLIRALCGMTESSAQAMGILDDPEREFVSSDIVELEVAAKAHYEKLTDAIAFYDAFFDNTVAFDRTSESAVGEALTLARTYGIKGFDAMLVAAAIRQHADEFITAEKPTKPLFRLVHPKTKVVSIHTT